MCLFPSDPRQAWKVEHDLVELLVVAVAIIREMVNSTPVPKYQTAEESAADKALSENELTFQIDDVRVGNLADIAHKKWADMPTVPDSGEILNVTPNIWNHMELHFYRCQQVVQDRVDAVYQHCLGANTHHTDGDG